MSVALQPPRTNLVHPDAKGWQDAAFLVVAISDSGRELSPVPVAGERAERRGAARRGPHERENGAQKVCDARHALEPYSSFQDPFGVQEQILDAKIHHKMTPKSIPKSTPNRSQNGPHIDPEFGSPNDPENGLGTAPAPCPPEGG